MDKSKNSMPKRSLCDTCCNRFDCRLPDAYGGCLGYERRPNPLDEDDDVSGRDGTHYGCEVEFSQSDRVADDWCVISDIPSSVIKAMEEKKAKENVPFLADEEENILEITFKSGETISYGKDEWDDYAYDGKAVIVKKNSAWIGIYNFDDVFCVELKEK